MKFILVNLFILFFLSACATSSNVSQEKNKPVVKKVYVFDDVTVKEDSSAKTIVNVTSVVDSATQYSDTTNLNKEVLKNNVRYFVQVGAFTTKARAERFVKLNENKITFPMQVSFSSEVKLFVVRLPYFRNRAEAEKVRNALWKMKSFKDAFIVTEIK